MTVRDHSAMRATQGHAGSKPEAVPQRKFSRVGKRFFTGDIDMDVLEAIRMRRSVRGYSLKPIPEDVMERMKQAKSSCLISPTR